MRILDIVVFSSAIFIATVGLTLFIMYILSI